MEKVSNKRGTATDVYTMLSSCSFLSVGDYLCICNGFLKCDSPNNKKGFSFKGKIFSPNWIKVFDIKEFEGVNCAVVKKHFNLGCNYYGSEYIIPLSEFEKQGCRPLKYLENIDWYVWGGKK